MNAMNSEDSGFDQSSIENSSIENSPKSSRKKMVKKLSIEESLKILVSKLTDKGGKTRIPLCRFCKNHNRKSLYILGHKTNCEGQYCTCKLCTTARNEQITSAKETRKSRAMTNRQLEKKLKDLKKQYNIPEDIPIDAELQITEFQLDKEKMEERKEATSYFLSEKPKSNKRRRTNELKTNELNTNEQKKDTEEIIFPRNFEELLHYSLECCLRYDNYLIKSLMNEIIAVNSKHICGKITLYDAKLYISKLFDESDKLNKLRCSVSSSNIVEIPQLPPSRWAYMAHSYFNVNGFESQNPYFWPFWNITGSLNALPHIDNLPKSSTESSTESSICYRPV